MGGVSFCKIGGIKALGVGETGLANCASKLGTTGKLGAVIEEVVVETVVDVVVCINYN